MSAYADPQERLRVMLAHMSAEFRDDCREKIDECDDILRRLSEQRDNWREDMTEMQRRSHSVKGSAGSFGFPAITLIAHKLEDYLEALDSLAGHGRDIRAFLDAIRDIAERGTNPPEEKYPAQLQSLPRHRPGFVPVPRAREIHVLLAIPKDVQRRIVQKELASCGFDVTCADTGVAAIGLALATRPERCSRASCSRT